MTTVSAASPSSALTESWSLLSRNGADITRTFPEISAALATAMDRPMVLDGEIVALDAKGVPSFARLQHRWPQTRRPTAELLRAVPVIDAAMTAIEALQVDDESVAQVVDELERDYLLSLAITLTGQGTIAQKLNEWEDGKGGDYLDIARF